jgi:DNA gyrase subunit B
VDGAVLELSSGEQRTGADLLDLVQTARAARGNLDRLATRAPAFAVEQGALAGLLGNNPDIAAAAARLDLYAEEGDGAWSGERGEGGGFVFSRIRRGVSEQVVLDDGLLRSADARRLAERAPALAENFSGVANFRRRDRVTTIRGPLDLVEAVFEAGRRGLSIQRYKGLGEMNPDQLWDTTMNPQTRTLLQVEVEDAAAVNDVFERLMGSEVEPRKKFIQAHAKTVTNLDI